MTLPGLRVVMTADTVGGVWSYACELIGALAPLGVEVTLATMGAPLSRSQVRMASRLPNLDLVASSYALEWMPDPWVDVDAAGDWLLEIEQRCRPDIVHLNGYVHAALPWGAPVICVAHSCVCTWIRSVHGLEAGPEWSDYRRRVARGLVLADAVVAPTAAILREILDAHDVTTDGRVISNGRSPAAWPRGRKDPFVLAAGRLWDEAKGLADLDACAPNVAWPINVAGPTTAPGSSLRRASHHVRLLGDLAPEELAGWMSRASIYAAPARYEPFGLAILEAALAGCALVLGDISTLREIWGDAAVFVRRDDTEALADAINALANDGVRRGTLARKARQRALLFSPARMALAYRELYDEVIPRTTTHQEVCA